jgi:hypothetical protein
MRRRSRDLAVVMAGVEFHESHEVFNCATLLQQKHHLAGLCPHTLRDPEIGAAPPV